MTSIKANRLHTALQNFVSNDKDAVHVEDEHGEPTDVVDHSESKLSNLHHAQENLLDMTGINLLMMTKSLLFEDFSFKAIAVALYPFAVLTQPIRTVMGAGMLVKNLADAGAHAVLAGANAVTMDE